MEYFDFVKKVNYEGEQSSNPFAFKFYDPDRVIFGKKMSEHLPFAMAWWHNLGAAGADMFGVRQEPEGLTVWGTDRLTGGEAHSCGDHRIAMLCACAAPFCTGPVLLRDAGCTDKSYPGFWADYRRLGGQTEEV